MHHGVQSSRMLKIDLISPPDPTNPLYNPNPNRNPTLGASSHAINVPATIQSDSLDLATIFARQIDSATLHCSKMLFAIRNLEKKLESRNSCLEKKSWPPHIIGQIKNMLPTVQLLTATSLLSTECSALKTKIADTRTNVKKAQEELFHLLVSTLTFTMSSASADIFITKQLFSLHKAFYIKLLQHMSKFQEAALKQEALLEKKNIQKVNNNMDHDADDLTKRIRETVTAELAKRNSKPPPTQKKMPQTQPKPKEQVTVKSNSKVQNHPNSKQKTNAKVDGSKKDGKSNGNLAKRNFIPKAASRKDFH